MTETITSEKDANRAELDPEGAKWPWLQTFTGKAFYYTDPIIDDIDIVDIAVGLSREARYAGQTCKPINRPYSVAQHSFYVSLLVPKGLELWGLLHDASEAYCKDMPHPMKQCVPDYRPVEKKVMKKIANRFGLPWPEPEAIKEADVRVMVTERRDICEQPPRPWRSLPEPYEFKIEPWDAQTACFAFLRRFGQLTGEDMTHALQLVS